jgi:hypothetical protein
MEFLTDGGWVSNGVLVIIVFGYTLVGLIFGGILGYERAEKKGYERERAAVAYEREYWEREQQGKELRLDFLAGK